MKSREESEDKVKKRDGQKGASKSTKKTRSFFSTKTSNEIDITFLLNNDYKYIQIFRVKSAKINQVVYDFKIGISLHIYPS